MRTIFYWRQSGFALVWLIPTFSARSGATNLNIGDESIPKLIAPAFRPQT